VRFWDASAIVPLILDESAADHDVVARDASTMCVWWGTSVEAVSAIVRREREGVLPAGQATHCLSRLDELSATWMEVAPSDALRDSARRLLRIHTLRAGDSLQLAAALVAAEGRPQSLEFICRDSRLATAASREGLKVIESRAT
jgi:predicted nucleic acid-binding protein